MHHRHLITLFIIISAIFVIAVSPLAAQTSSLQGLITDPTSAIVPGAAVTITNTETSATRQELTDELGAYKFLQVLPGPYKVEVQLPGFTTKVSQVILQVGQPATLNLELAVGQATDVVNVMAETTTVNTQDATVGNPFTEKQVIELPLQTRNVVALLSAEPGVASSGQVLGSRPDQNNVVLDGANVNDNRGSDGFNSVLQIPLDSVQEFRTTIAGQGADLGHTAGGQVSIVTKSGTNAFHGSAYEYNRNTDFEANDWFSNRAHVARPALIRNQYGASLGGPIKKNKLFFFYNWEGRKDRSQSSATATVPSDSLKQGIVKVLLKSGQTVNLTPADVKALDPLGIGENPYITNLIQQYPSGNNPLGASDKGLNFNTLLFNAAQPLNNHVQVAKLDYIVDSASKHTVSLRGTLVGDSTVPSAGLALFPGGQSVQQTLDNSRGLSLHYTYVVTPSLVNAFTYGYTRLGNTSTGSLNVVPSFGFTTLLPTTRASIRIAPTPNLTDDITWTRTKHTIQAGFSYIESKNLTTSANNEPSYSFSSGVLLGLGNDITNDVTAYIQKTIPGAALSSNANTLAAFGAIFGMLNGGSATYNFGINGQPIPFGAPVTRDFNSRSPEWYFQDTWKVKSNLTLISGLRYSLYGVPYEENGVEVVPQTPISAFFSQRVAGALAGIPNYAVPNSIITYQIGGPVNHGPGYYPQDKKDWAPRLALAYSPTSGSMLEKILGSGSVLRTGASLIYDNYGNAMGAQFSSSGSPGLSTAVQQVANTDYSSSPRYDGTPATLTHLATATGGAFPFTPPLLIGGFTSFTNVQSNLKAPYQYILSANYARPLPGHMSIEVGYAGRLAHRAIVKPDYGQPLENFVDPKSKEPFTQAAKVLADIYYSGVTTAQVKANPSLIPLQPFVENIMPALANNYITGSASANLYYDVYSKYAGSWTDTINDVDRIRQPNGGCLVIYGCNTFFPVQSSGVYAYSNFGQSAFHAMTVTLRRRVSNGWGYDFNYTWSHAIDNGSASESSGGTNIQNSFCPRCGMGPGDYDARHAVNANAVLALPVGKGKSLFNNTPKIVDGIIGGWQVSTLFSFHTGNPITCSATSQFNTNYHSSSYCMLAPGITSVPANHLQFDQLGIPSIFANTNVSADFVPGYAGQVGYRGILRGLHYWNDDMAISKSFKVSEGKQLSFRVEAYNLMNTETFSNPSLSVGQLAGSTTAGGTAAFGSVTFGEIKSTASTTAPRVLQAALRLTF
ncbi:MAG TPA: TonB-dependent receptor [Terriglobia bacterium]